MRMLVIKQDTDVEALAGSLLSARLGDSQGAAALARLQALNPHVDFRRLRAGTVLLVPSERAFKASASDSVAGQALAGFTETVQTALNAAVERTRAGLESRATERTDVQAVFRLAAVKRLLDSDPELKQFATDASKSFQDDERLSKENERALSTSAKAALVKLKDLDKLVG